MNDEKMTAALNFRVPQTFRAQVDALARDTKWDASEIARIGMLVFWPDIEAIVRVSEVRDPSDENVNRLRELAGLLKSVKRLGLDLRSVLIAAVEEKLAHDSMAAGKS